VKRIGYLYQRIPDYDNLLGAFHAAARGKHRGDEVRKFRDSLDENIRDLRSDLLSERVALGDYHYFTIYDPKERRICAASFRERVIHHAVMNVVGRHLERPLIDGTFACRQGKGQHRAALAARQFAARFPFFLKMDIRKYYDTIDHVRVADQLRRIFKDAALLRFFDRLLRTYHTQPGRGLPIGNLTSQYLANLYLSPLDHFVNRQLCCSSYVRYMDDIVLWGTRQQVRTWRRAATDFLADTLVCRSSTVASSIARHTDWISSDIECLRISSACRGDLLAGCGLVPPRWSKHFDSTGLARTSCSGGLRLCMASRRPRTPAVCGVPSWLLPCWRTIDGRFGERVMGRNRVYRGGSWNDDGRNCRSAYRNANEPGNRNDNLGFRVCLARSPHDGPKWQEVGRTARFPVRARLRRIAEGEAATGSSPDGVVERCGFLFFLQRLPSG